MQCPGLGAGSGDHTPSSCIECGAQSRAARPRPLLPPAVSVRSQIDVCLYICVSPAVSFSSVGRHPTNYIYICVSVSYTCPSACPISIPPPPPLYCNAPSLLIHVYYLLMNRQHCDRVVQDEGTAVVLVVWCVVWCVWCVCLSPPPPGSAASHTVNVIVFITLPHASAGPIRLGIGGLIMDGVDGTLAGVCGHYGCCSPCL